MCNQFAFYHRFWIKTWSSKFEQQTVFCLHVDPMDKNHEDPDVIELSVPRLVQYLHTAWKRHQDAVCWVDINLALKKGLEFYRTRSNATTLQEARPVDCVPKVVRMETGEVIYEKLHMPPRPPPKDLLETRMEKRIGVQNTFNDQMLGSYAEVSNEPNQF